MKKLKGKKKTTYVIQVYISQETAEWVKEGMKKTKGMTETEFMRELIDAARMNREGTA